MLLLLLPESLEDEAALSLVDFAGVSVFESPEDFESEAIDEEPSLEPFLFSEGGLGRP